MTINERLFTIMDMKGITSADLAKGTGIRANTISDWKTKGTNPSADKIYRICDFMGISVDFLLTGEETASGDLTVENMSLKEQLDFYYNHMSEIEQQLVIHRTAVTYYENLLEKEREKNSPN